MKHNSFTLKCTIAAFVLGILMMTVGMHLFFDFESQAQAANIRDKRVVSVIVERDDTIWTIASRYYTEECGSMKDYVAEIKKCNSLDNDTIYAGYPLLIPIWVSEDEAVQLQDRL